MEFSCHLSLEEEESRKDARENYKKWVLFEEMSWKQKSREIWLKEGDRNTSFFHKMDNAHRRRNQMAKIKINGSWITEDCEIKEEVRRAFQLLLSTSGDWQPSKGWRSLFRRRRCLGHHWVLMGIRLQAQTGSPWPSSSFGRSL